jgi:hypothetical protein
VVGEAELLRSTNTVYKYFLCNWIIIVATIALLSAEASRITRMQVLNKAMKHWDLRLKENHLGHSGTKRRTNQILKKCAVRV